MKPFLGLNSILLAALLPFLTGCDGGSSLDSTDQLNELTKNIVRGLDLDEINSNPFGTPGLPYTLVDGESITFLPTDTDPFNFVDSVPLGTWVAESSQTLRQGSTNSSFTYFPVDEHTFQYLYSVEPVSSTTVSNSSRAFIEYAFNHRFERSDFVEKMNVVYNASAEPGSLQYELLNGGRVADEDLKIIDAASSIGIAAANLPVNNSRPFVRRSRNITLRDVTSTNADLQGANPIITGNYVLIDTWQEVETLGDEGPLSLVNINGRDVLRSEVSTGAFIMRLNTLSPQL